MDAQDGGSHADLLSGGGVGVRQPQVLHGLAVRLLVLQRTVVAFEQRDEQRQREERVGAQFEQPHMVLVAQGPALLIGEGEPGRLLTGGAVEEPVGEHLLPPGHGAGGVRAVPLDQFGVAIDGVEELVQQVLAHAGTPFGYQVKYASIVWKRSSESTWSALAPSPATPIISMKSMNPWVALPGRCRLSRVTSARQPSMSPPAIHSTALRSNSGSGPWSPN